MDLKETERKMIAGLPEKTGRSLEEWRTLFAAGPARKHGEIVAWPKSEHGITHGIANLIAHKLLSSDAGSSDAAELLAAQYAGAKAGMRPIYDAVLARIATFGSDIEIAPKKGYKTLTTNSAKMAFYAPGQFGLPTHYGNLGRVMQAAIDGVWR